MRGQALAETVLVLVPVTLLALGLILVVLAHRVMTAAEAAAYNCAAVAASEPLRGEELGREAAVRTLSGWSGPALSGRVWVEAGRSGAPVRCRVEVWTPLPLGRYVADYDGSSEALRGRW